MYLAHHELESIKSALSSLILLLLLLLWLGTQAGGIMFIDNLEW